MFLCTRLDLHSVHSPDFYLYLSQSCVDFLLLLTNPIACLLCSLLSLSSCFIFDLLIDFLSCCFFSWMNYLLFIFRILFSCLFGSSPKLSSRALSSKFFLYYISSKFSPTISIRVIFKDYEVLISSIGNIGLIMSESSGIVLLSKFNFLYSGFFWFAPGFLWFSNSVIFG